MQEKNKSILHKERIFFLCKLNEKESNFEKILTKEKWRSILKTVIRKYVSSS